MRGGQNRKFSDAGGQSEQLKAGMREYVRWGDRRATLRSSDSHRRHARMRADGSGVLGWELFYQCLSFGPAVIDGRIVSMGTTIFDEGARVPR
ncbi:hypothetical protein K788_00010205 (plasmid) [Paraburkholderia caribensis MBA4]|uniref:Uncharacterized protein n=1 Tax=Paraburkholderia caribensis MBA4 TaxID=1323664 RepID=A0A0P0RQK9_9BURK|nr:hypothetical protein K788_00010205 [Paraburkholderia caribensis MBA4]